MRILIHYKFFNVDIDLGTFVGCNSWCLPNKKEIFSQQQWIIFASSAEMFMRFAKKIVVPQKGTENWHSFKGLLNTRQKPAGGEGWKVYTEINSENLTVAKQEPHFLGGARIWVCSESAPILSEEENDAFPEKRIKTNPEISLWLQWEMSKNNQGNKAEVGIPGGAGDGEERPAESNQSSLLLLSGAAAWCVLSSASAPPSRAVLLMSW